MTTAVGTVVAIVATLVVVGIATNGSEAPPGPSARVSPAVLANLTDVPATTLDVVGSGTSNNPPQPVSGALRSSDGKPEVLYLGARTAAGLRTPSRSVMTTSTS